MRIGVQILSFHNDVRGFKDDPTYYEWREAEAKRVRAARPLAGIRGPASAHSREYPRLPS